MTVYIHQRPDWPRFRWSDIHLASQLGAVRLRQGRFIGRMEALGFPLRAEAVLQSLTEEAVQSSEIEGEVLDRKQVRSSLARRLGMDIGALTPADRQVEGVVEMTLDATQRYAKPVTDVRLFGWHRALFPAGRRLSPITLGAWRTPASGPMQVVSGPFGRETVHYEAPEAARVAGEMNAFLEWLNQDVDEMDAVLKAGVAHLWFVTIHPLDDGNGRIGRAIADLLLARSEASPQRFYSMSAQIRRERSRYYDILESTQKGDLDITPWLQWFLGCLDRAFDRAETTLASVLRKSEFWVRHAASSLNDRQRLVLHRLLDGFEGKLTSSKWATLTKSSSDTALRDIADLLKRGILVKEAAGGRSTSYTLPP